VRVFHRTSSGQQSIQGGFRDGRGTYLTTKVWEGVWLSDVPLDPREGADGDDVLVIGMPENVVEEYEWVEEGKPYREFLVPAEVVNRYPVRFADDDDLAVTKGDL
jgi:hypothetical protein